MAAERPDPADPEGTHKDNSQAPKFDKAQVNAAFKQKLTQMRDEFQRSTDDAAFMTREADGPMQTRYDTTKTEQAWLANALGGLTENVDRILKDWDTTFTTESTVGIGVGSLVHLDDLEYGEKEWFYVMPFGGGVTVEMEGENIRGLSTDSILGKNLVGKEEGQTIQYKAHPDDFEDQRFKILEIL